MVAVRGTVAGVNGPTGFNSQQFTVPTETQPGLDCLVAILATNSTAAADAFMPPTTTGTWTLLTGPDATNGNLFTTVWVKDAVAGDPGATLLWTTSPSTSSRLLGSMAVLAQTSAASLLWSLARHGTTSTSHVSPTLASVPAGATLLNIMAARVGTAAPAPTVTVPSGFTEDLLARTSESTSPNWSIEIAHRTVSPPTAGTYGGDTYVTSATAADHVYTISAAITATSRTGEITGPAEAADSLTAVRTQVQAVSDQAEATDSLRAVRTVSATVTDAAEASGSISAGVGVGRTVTATDTAAASSSVTALRGTVTQSPVSSEPVTAADSLTFVKSSAPTMVPLDLYLPYPDGTLNRYQGEGTVPPPPRQPSAPQALRVTLAAGNGTLTWTPPASDGGWPLLGYEAVNVTTGAVQDLGLVLTATFPGLSTAQAYTFTVGARYALGVGDTASVRLAPVSEIPFPGYPGKGEVAVLGLDEGDDDPQHITTGERAAPETLARVPIGAMRAYFNDPTGNPGDATGILAVPNGGMASRIRAHAARGRMTFGSIHFDNVGLAGDGRNDAAHYDFIAYVEEQLDVPFHYTCQHEVDGPDLTTAAVNAWGKLMKTVAWQRDKYADAHGGVGTYRWHNFALSFILTASGFARGEGTGAVGPLWRAATYTTGVSAAASTDVFTANNHMLTNGCRVRLLSPPAGLSAGVDYFITAGTANTFKLAASRGGAAVNVTADASGITVIYKELFNFAACDGYQFPLSAYADSLDGRTGFPVWQANIIKTVAWVEDPAHTYSLAFTEFGVHYNDGDAGTQLGIFLEKVLKGGHDTFACYYFNSNGNGNRDPAQWALMNIRDDRGTNDKLLDVFVAYMKDPRFLHFWEMVRPDGTTPAKPVGV